MSPARVKGAPPSTRQGTQTDRQPYYRPTSSTVHVRTAPPPLQHTKPHRRLVRMLMRVLPWTSLSPLD